MRERGFPDHGSITHAGDSPSFRTKRHIADFRRILEREEFHAGDKIPELDGFIATAADETESVRMKRDGSDSVGMSCERELFLTALRIPDLDSLIPAPARNVFSVGTDRHPRHTL